MICWYQFGIQISWEPNLPLHRTRWHCMIVQRTCEEEVNPDRCGLYLRVKLAHSSVPPKGMSHFIIATLLTAVSSACLGLRQAATAQPCNFTAAICCLHPPKVTKKSRTRSIWPDPSSSCTSRPWAQWGSYLWDTEFFFSLLYSTFPRASAPLGRVIPSKGVLGFGASDSAAHFDKVCPMQVKFELSCIKLRTPHDWDHWTPRCTVLSWKSCA